MNSQQLEIMKAKIELDKLKTEREKNRIEFYKVIAENRSDIEIIQIANVIAKLDQELFKDFKEEIELERNPKTVFDMSEETSDTFDSISNELSVPDKSLRSRTASSGRHQPKSIEDDFSAFKALSDEDSSNSSNQNIAKANDIPQKRTKYKILVAGPSRSGKTCFLELVDNNKFVKDHKATQATKARSFEVDAKLGSESCLLSYILVDTPGNYTAFKENCLNNCKEADAVLLFYDTSDLQSYEESGLSKWLRYVRSRCTNGIPIIIIGNKKDLSTPVGASKFSQISDDNVEFCKISCKIPENQHYPFIALTRRLLHSKDYRVKFRPISRRERNTK